VGKSKKPKWEREPSPSKIAKFASNPDGYNDRNPAWRISKIEMVDPFGWHNLNAQEIKNIQTKLSEFESMIWNEISVQGKKQHHSVTIDQLSKEAQTRLEEKNIVDIDELFSLRLSGKQRVWGILEQGILNLLWWDPNHQVCPSNKKHT
jgi:hypothetical protein